MEEKKETGDVIATALVQEATSEPKTVKDERAAIVYISSTFNNTIVHFTDLAGNTIARVSGGMVTKQARLKANPTTAMFIAKKVAEEIKELGINSLYVRTRAKTNSPGMGPGANTIIRTMSKDGF